ncbi:MAG: redoxin domain-containing protein [Deltaproteobacteria bacterium]|nr:redoxin domain-containing protein [Deltaproteobacteria bacterium]MBN2673893.1 redoxin domain-containing protein [Deltaproteobacteria bacterium]
MKRINSKPLVIDDEIPDVMGRTDEGTPISLVDFKGRNLAVFFLGAVFDRTEMTLVKSIKRRIDEFLEFDCSPIVVSMEADDVLGSVREGESLPFLMVSDRSGGIHASVAGGATDQSLGAWLVNDESRIVSAIHPMPPRELVSATVAALARVVERSPERES